SWFMMSSLLTDRIIEECLEQEDSEEENVSEIEDFEEHSDHESGTEQEASDSDGSSVSEESFPSNLQIENTEDEEYLEDVPLKSGRNLNIVYFTEIFVIMSPPFRLPLKSLDKYSVL
ncbi:unnamed protein product, partial [Parnassius apollo]